MYQNKGHQCLILTGDLMLLPYLTQLSKHHSLHHVSCLNFMWIHSLHCIRCLNDKRSMLKDRILCLESLSNCKFFLRTDHPRPLQVFLLGPSLIKEVSNFSTGYIHGIHGHTAFHVALSPASTDHC